MRDGRIAGHLSRAELTEENIERLGMHHARRRYVCAIRLQRIPGVALVLVF